MYSNVFCKNCSNNKQPNFDDYLLSNKEKVKSISSSDESSVTSIDYQNDSNLIPKILLSQYEENSTNSESKRHNVSTSA